MLEEAGWKLFPSLLGPARPHHSFSWLCPEHPDLSTAAEFVRVRASFSPSPLPSLPPFISPPHLCVSELVYMCPDTCVRVLTRPSKMQESGMFSLFVTEERKMLAPILFLSQEL